MKNLFTKTLYTYFSIGLFFGAINQFSWVYSSFATLYYEFSLVFSFAGIFVYAWSVFVHITFEPIIRAIFWLPSILSLLSPDINISFGQWIAPGFYQLLLSAEK